jgi:hypothetical protein
VGFRCCEGKEIICFGNPFLKERESSYGRNSLEVGDGSINFFQDKWILESIGLKVVIIFFFHFSLEHNLKVSDQMNFETAT